MKLDEFRALLDEAKPPPGAGHAVAAMWYDSKGDWDAAHAEAQAQEDETGAWVHAYLHRVEGDLPNAGYWYRRAGRPVCNDPLETERDTILAELLRDM